MAAFSTDDIFGRRLDFEIARDGFVCPLRGEITLRDAESWFRHEGYRVLEMEAGGWVDDRHMLATFAAALSFPDYFGMNLDALNDCMSDVAEAEYGWDASETGVVMVLDGFNRFADRRPRTVHHLREILRRQGRYASLFGNRVLTILA
ncbi:barstar family protein [Curtobacterium sp. MCBD17_040]|uniref:barstar family protein n=1 Tax=Curtobacterium sp. MCBD17_040 TaxID=2175674 RepID=UPI0015E8C426|nr:barstar family protein [Curtobacterium sp. MCBD17_040]WIB65784.1 barstar family protein [Curtobacterium sp. MCBD17_040]